MDSEFLYFAFPCVMFASLTSVFLCPTKNHKYDI